MLLSRSTIITAVLVAGIILRTRRNFIDGNWYEYNGEFSTLNA